MILLALKVMIRDKFLVIFLSNKAASTSRPREGGIHPCSRQRAALNSLQYGSAGEIFKLASVLKTWKSNSRGCGLRTDQGSPLSLPSVRTRWIALAIVPSAMPPCAVEPMLPSEVAPIRIKKTVPSHLDWASRDTRTRQVAAQESINPELRYHRKRANFSALLAGQVRIAPEPLDQEHRNSVIVGVLPQLQR